jgi:ubiquinone/menaquinone biosynthesis C-methylase UbiE
MSHTSVETREAAHFDAVASDLSEETLALMPITDRVEHRRFALMGELGGRLILDVGCGDGAWAVRIAATGANVEAIDISPRMVDMTRRRAELLGLDDRVAARVMSAVRLEYGDATFDAVHGQDIIHHLDPDTFGREIARVLKPGGVAVFRENNGSNAILMFARDKLCGRFGIPKWSSADEYPLTPERLRQFTQHFGKVELEYPYFFMFHYVDSKFFRFRFKPLSIAIRGLDIAIGSIPWLRRYSYQQLIAVTR